MEFLFTKNKHLLLNTDSTATALLSVFGFFFALAFNFISNHTYLYY